MAKKTVRRKQSKKPKHSVYEKRAYYIGYGNGLHHFRIFTRKPSDELFEQGELLVRKVFHIQPETVYDVNPSAITLRGVDRVLQREAQHVIFDCAFADAELECKILSCIVPASAKGFQ